MLETTPCRVIALFIHTESWDRPNGLVRRFASCLPAVLADLRRKRAEVLVVDGKQMVSVLIL